MIRCINTWWHREDCWVRLAQIFVGLFFVGAGLFKLFNYFIIGDQSLIGHFQFWLDNGWPPLWYAEFMRWGQAHPKPLQAFTILFQLIPGALLVVHLWRRPAAAILLFMQLGIFMGVFHHRGFNEFVGISLWIVLFYLLAPDKSEQWHRKLWAGFTFLLIGLALLQLYNRLLPGDPWIANIAWQREHLAADVMSFSPAWKAFVLGISETTWGHFLWVASFWFQLLCILLLITRLRLYAGAALLLIWILHVWTWTNAVTSQGVLWTLVFFVWTTQEELLQRKKKPGFLFRELLR